MMKKNEVNFCEIETAKGRLWVPYELRRSRRSRYIRLSLSIAKHALLTLPLRSTDEEGVLFLKSQGEWITRKMGVVSRHLSMLEYLHKKPFITAGAKKTAVEIRFTKGNPHVEWNPLNESVQVKIDSTENTELQLRDALYSFAKSVIKQRALCLVDKTGVQIHRISVRDQSTVWGSCSDRRNISLNWRLLLLTPPLQDYIIYHEIAHLTHLNHSSSYWKLLRSYDPQAGNHDHRISQLSMDIMPLGRDK